jgi:hypothetical protein
MEKPVALLVKRSSSVYSKDVGLPHLQAELLKLSDKGKEGRMHKLDGKGSVDYETVEGTILAGNLCFGI